MAEFDLSFSPSSFNDGGSFKLLELPPDLCKLIEHAIDNILQIKGQAGDDAVLCTAEKTFAVRSVALSNSVLVVTPPLDASAPNFTDDALVIRDQINEILELTPSVPKLHALTALLRGREYDDGQENDEMYEKPPEDMAIEFKYTYYDALRNIQASDAELDRGLKDRHILNINGELRPIAPSYLNRLLELILNGLTALSLSHESASVEILSSSLADEHEVPRVVSTQVMSWFGIIKDGRWKMEVNTFIKEVGLGVLRHHRQEPIRLNQLMAKWKSLVGDTFENHVDLSLLSGNYLVSISDQESLTYFPASSLPIDPAPRFADLFSTRSRWKGKDISPFLADIAINSKERDKLLLKFARATTDPEGTWYTARAQYNG
ncbi:hypothetical protein D9615_000479 [Tricholomella constricta]|uniref:Sister chromatid cohesion protein DCC1 n=1 Tax=Tricholomella constricta TaxID=117010 RepID=A0A8H5MAX8_9AGAR|nr:hypothetical protein D9615_000479 [Tricholomella constricta]